MTPTQHTPAPWYYDNADYVREVATDYCIARVFDDNAHPHPEHVESLPIRANARLIAAAPELLELLKDAVARADQDEIQDAHWFIPALNAIALAEGKKYDNNTNRIF